MVERDSQGRALPGSSLNPAGRPPQEKGPKVSGQAFYEKGEKLLNAVYKVWFDHPEYLEQLAEQDLKGFASFTTALQGRMMRPVETIPDRPDDEMTCQEAMEIIRRIKGEKPAIEPDPQEQ